MRRPLTVAALEELGRVQLSPNFFMRDFLYSEISNFYGIANIPSDPDLAIKAGERLCQELLEPLSKRFGRIAIRSAFRSEEVNQFGNENNLKCARNEANYAAHIWDRRDLAGRMGATACIVIPWFADQFEAGKPWQSMAWWIHDNLNYSSLFFFPKRAAFNLQWREDPERRIDSFIEPKGNLTKRGKGNWSGDHTDEYAWFPQSVGAAYLSGGHTQ